MDDVFWMCLGILVGWCVSWFAKNDPTQEEQEPWNYK